VISNPEEIKKLEMKLRKKMLAEGPMPVIEAPNADAVKTTMRKFREKKPVREADLKILIEQAVAEYRRELIDANKKYWFKKKNEPVVEDILYLSGDRCEGQCTNASIAFEYMIRAFTNDNVNIFHKQIPAHQNVTAHGFIKTKQEYEMFTLVNLKGSDKVYLIDTVFRMYFREMRIDGYIVKNRSHPVKKYLIEHDKNLKMTNKLLKDGYIELNDDYANIFVNALHSGAGNDLENDVTVQKFLKRHYAGYYEETWRKKIASSPATTPEAKESRVSLSFENQERGAVSQEGISSPISEKAEDKFRSHSKISDQVKSLLHKRKFDEAIKIAEKGVNDNLGVPHYWSTLIRALIRARRYKRAVKVGRDAYSIFSSDIYIINDFANALLSNNILHSGALKIFVQ